MPTYRTKWDIVESGYGIVTREFVVSDSYDKLFSDPATVDVSLFDVDSTKHDVELSTGVQAEDELQFIVNESVTRSQDDADAIVFVKEAQNPSNKRFCALFIQPEPGVKTTASLEFSGVILPAQNAEDVRWFGAQFTDTPTPLRSWKFTVKSFDVNVFDSAEVEDLVRNQKNGKDNGLTDGLAKRADWSTDFPARETENIADRLAYFRTENREVRFSELVNLNKVLRGLADILQERLRVQLNVPSYSIIIDTTTIDGKFTPARFRHALVTDQDNSNISYRTRYCGWDGDPLLGGAFASKSFYKVFANDAVTLKLGDTATPAESPWIHWRMVDPPAGSRNLSFLRATTFADLLYMIAAAFGMFVQFRYTDSTTMHIQFVSRTGLKRERVYIPGVTKASLKVSPFSASRESLVAARGQSCVYGVEGDDVYEHITDDVEKNGYWIPSAQVQQQGSSEKLLFTLSPTVRRQTRGEDDSSEVATGLYLPHNARFYDYGERKAHHRNVDELYRTTDPSDKHIHTAIYVQCVGVQDPADPRVGYGTNGATVYLPAVAVSVQDGAGTEREFRELSGYVNFLRGVQGDAFNNEYELSVPFMCSFRKGQDGSHADDDGGRGRWQNAQAGSTIVLDGIEYLAFGIERKHKQHETALRLHAVTAYSFQESAGVQSVGDSAPPELFFAGSMQESVTSSIERSYIACEEVVQGDAVFLDASSEVHRASAYQDSHSRVAGIALNSAIAGDIVRIGNGTVTCQAWSFTVGERVYIRNTTLPTTNLSSTPIAAPTTQENTHICVGVAIGTSTLEYEVQHDFIYEEFLQ